MGNVIFDITGNSAKALVEGLRKGYPDSIPVLSPPAGSLSVHAPATKGKYKGYHRIKAEFWIPEDALEGEGALEDFGLTAIIRLPKDRVKPHLIRTEEEQEDEQN